jgi:S1-C subfamily serine protease
MRKPNVGFCFLPGLSRRGEGPASRSRLRAGAWSFGLVCLVLASWLGRPAAGLAEDKGIPSAVLKAVKRSTVYLRITSPNGDVLQGSGFFGVEPGIVLTNAHVLGMLRPEGRKPTRIDVVLNSGETDEKVFSGQVLGVDRNSDLAVLRVAGKEMPEPLKVGSARELEETQEVYVFGFPYGKDLGKNITISKTSVSSLRKNNAGNLTQVQVNGGMHPGNSGGPVVDARGRVIGVAVLGIKGTQINFAVPGDYIQTVLNGRITGVALGQPYVEAGKVRLTATIDVLDPLNRFRKASLVFWAGPPGAPRPPSATEPKALPGDGPHQVVALDYANGTAKAEVTLPSLAAGQVYWMQPLAVNGAGDQNWLAAVVQRTPPPVERKPLVLKFKQPLGSRALVGLTSKTTLKIRDSGEEHSAAITLTTDLEEETEADLDTEDNATTQVRYKKLNLAIKFDNEALPPSDAMDRMIRGVLALKGELHVDAKGNVFVPKAARALRTAAGEMHTMLLQALHATAVPLPGKEVTWDKPWTDQRELSISTLGPPQEAVADLRYSYLGIRTGAGPTVAVLRLEGVLHGPKGKERSVGGRMHGTVLIDAATGMVLSAQSVFDVDMDVGEGARASRASGTLEVSLLRKPAPK